MAEEDEQQSSSGFAGMQEKASIEYLTQIVGPMREIKDTYSRLRRDWKRLNPNTRLDLYHLMQSKWEIMKTSTVALSEISGYPFVARLMELEVVVRRDLKMRMLRLIEEDKNAPTRLNPHPCNSHKLQDETAELHWKLKDLESYMALDRILRMVGESERALFKCGVLLSPLYMGHDLLGDIKNEISGTSKPVDIGVIERPKKVKSDG